MKAVGIIAEYNPLHNGHIYHLEQARKLSGADASVVAMSGNYVQRGEPAFFDKWTRAEHALKCGADLVVEIPVLFCLGNAGQYARAGVRLLESTGKVTHIAFGSESGDTEFLKKIAGDLVSHSSEIAAEILSLRGEGLSFPAARERAFFSVAGEGYSESDSAKIRRILSSSNDILALEYIMASESAEPLAIRRAGAGYDAPYDIRFDYQSASALRAQAFNGHDVSRFVPECVALDIRTDRMTGTRRDMWFDILRYAVMSAPAGFIEDCPSGGEGLANLMKKEIVTASNWENFVRRVQSKRYTYSRISRLCMQIILGITRTAYPAAEPEYIRILGFNSKGRELLSEIRDSESACLPLITNINKQKDKLQGDAFKLLELDKHGSDIYNLIIRRNVAACSDNVKHPVLYEN